MKKNAKLLIVVISLVVLLGAALVIVLLLPSDSNKITLNDGQEILLFDKSDCMAEQITVNNEGGEYELLAFAYTKPATQSSLSENSSGLPVVNPEESSESSTELVYTMQEYPNYTLDQNMTNDLAEQCCYLAARELVDKSGQRYSEYGLDQPRATVSVRYNDATLNKFYLGKEAPDNKGVYLRVEGDRNVYLVQSSLVEAFFLEKLQLFDKQLTGLMEDIEQVHCSGTHYPEEIHIAANPYECYTASHLMELPFRYACDNTKFNAITGSACNLKAIWVTAVDITEEDIKRYGLDDPYQRFAMKGTDGSTISLLASEKDSEGRFYLMRPDDNMIFQTYAAENAWYDLQKTDFWPDRLLRISTENIQTTTLTISSVTTAFQLSKEKGVNENYYETASLTLTVDGQEFSYVNYSIFLNNLYAAQRLPQATPAALSDGSKEVLQIRFDYFEPKDFSDTLVLWREPSGKTLAVLSGVPLCYIDSTYADQLAEQAVLLLNGQPIDSLTQESSSSSESA